MAPQKSSQSYSNLITPTLLLTQYNMLNDMLADMRYPWDMHIKINTQDFVPTYKNVTVYYKEGESMIIIPPKKPKKKKKPRHPTNPIQPSVKESAEESEEESANIKGGRPPTQVFMF